MEQILSSDCEAPYLNKTFILLQVKPCYTIFCFIYFYFNILKETEKTDYTCQLSKSLSVCLAAKQCSLTQDLSGGHDFAGIHGSHESLGLSQESVTAGLLHGSDQLA